MKIWENKTCHEKSATDECSKAFLSSPALSRVFGLYVDRDVEIVFYFF